MYDYKATVVEWHDADTVKLDIDQGFGNSKKCWIRLIDCWAPELDTAEGKKALAYCDNRWPAGTELFVSTRKPSADFREFEGKQLGQSFARWLGQVYVDDFIDGVKIRVADILISRGLATIERGQ